MSQFSPDHNDRPVLARPADQRPAWAQDATPWEYDDVSWTRVLFAYRGAWCVRQEEVADRDGVHHAAPQLRYDDEATYDSAAAERLAADLEQARTLLQEIEVTR